MAEVVIRDIEGVLSGITVASSVVVKRGNLIGLDSSGYATLADADAATNELAQYVALDDGDGNDSTKNLINACRRCTFYDLDAPYTVDTAQYLSGTAGATTETRPATNGDLIQVVGRSIDTYNARIEIEPPKEWEMFVTPDTLDTTGEPGLGAVDTGWAGPQIDAAGETVYFKGRLPSGLVGSITVARVVYNSINGSALDMDASIVGAYDGGTNNQDTGTAITAGDWNADTDNLLLYQDVSALFDSGFYKPGRNFCVLLDPDAITNDATVIGLYLRGWKV